MDNNDKLRKIVQEVVHNYLKESDVYFKYLIETTIEEDRITNVEAGEKVKNKENFIGSHTFGEDIGKLGKMYVAFSYGRDHPLYMFFDGKWYRNAEDNVDIDGYVNIWTKKHLEDLNPGDAEGVTKAWMKKKINKFMNDNNIEDLSHTDIEPGDD